MLQFARPPILFFCLALPCLLQAQKPDRNPDLTHIREELGINEFTAPSIGLLFEELEALGPVALDKAWRDVPENSPQDRPRLALCAGQVIADGFLAVQSQKQSRVETASRTLLKLAKGLGVGDRITKHGKELVELALRENWSGLKKQLIRAQAEVESGLMALKDEELAHLVSLGGWLRGLEITATVVTESYTPDRAKTLIQPELYDYFLDRLNTIDPELKKTPLFQTLTVNLGRIRLLSHKPPNTPIELAEAKEIRNLIKQINQAIADPAQ